MLMSTIARGMQCILLLAVAVVSPFSCVAAAESGAITGLPKQLHSCNLIPEPNCGTWAWDGQHYQCRWENGAVGTMTVKRFGAGGVLIERRDTTGKYAGLVAVYTGTWNGKQIVDGKLTRTLPSGNAVYKWTATLE